jgi:hypothetical protein
VQIEKIEKTRQLGITERRLLIQQVQHVKQLEKGWDLLDPFWDLPSMLL